jgi:hypothetical protein
MTTRRLGLCIVLDEASHLVVVKEVRFVGLSSVVVVKDVVELSGFIVGSCRGGTSTA